MAKTKTTFIKSETIAEGTMAFYFKKPENFTQIAGQYIDITLINPPETDAEGDTRTFSLITTPSNEHIGIATRMRDTAFKRNLKGMTPGTEIEISGPMGSFTLHENSSKPAVFLSGGIGITPFHSIILDAADKQLQHKIYLFYSNRRPEDTAFYDDLLAAEKNNSNFKFIPTMTEMSKSAKTWTGEEGYITKEMIERHVPDLSNAIYYIAGPETMVYAMREMLTDSGVSRDDIKTEEFAGY